MKSDCIVGNGLDDVNRWLNNPFQRNSTGDKLFYFYLFYKIEQFKNTPLKLLVKVIKLKSKSMFIIALLPT